jgi:hypothetical protein
LFSKWNINDLQIYGTILDLAMSWVSQLFLPTSHQGLHKKSMMDVEQKEGEKNMTMSLWVGFSSVYNFSFISLLMDLFAFLLYFYINPFHKTLKKKLCIMYSTLFVIFF